MDHRLIVATQAACARLHNSSGDRRRARTKDEEEASSLPAQACTASHEATKRGRIQGSSAREGLGCSEGLVEEKASSTHRTRCNTPSETQVPAERRATLATTVGSSGRHSTETSATTTRGAGSTSPPRRISRGRARGHDIGRTTNIMARRRRPRPQAGTPAARRKVWWTELRLSRQRSPSTLGQRLSKRKTSSKADSLLLWPG